MPSLSDLHVGDKIQRKSSAVDLNNGATGGSRYVEGGTEWGYVGTLYSGNRTVNTDKHPTVKKGQKTDAVLMLGYDNKTVVWVVTPNHISDNIIHMNDCGPKVTPAPTAPVPTPAPTVPVVQPTVTVAAGGQLTTKAYATTEAATSWVPTRGYRSETVGVMNDTLDVVLNEDGTPLSATPSNMDDGALAAEPGVAHNTSTDNRVNPYSAGTDGIPLKSLARPRGSSYNPVEKISTPFSVESIAMKRVMLNEERSLIQNSDGYPRKTGANYSFGNYMPNKYEYATADSAINRPTFTSKLEDNLMKVRAAFGLPVHGDPDIARTMRYFLYNRFKSPDINMAHNRSFTHVFFTRPELNILDYSDGVRGRGLAQQCQNHTEAQLLWLRNPIIFQLLSYNGDVDNFNLMLSNAVQSFDFEDEYLTYLEMGRSWQEHAIQYGDSYNGRAAGEVSLRFIDDKDYSIINMIKLWITYIDNVSRGAWKPSYNNISSHGFNRTIDYGASMYVFKVAEDGSDVLYWTKYYGIFPLNTGASALSWETGQSVGEAPRLNIRFRYSMKRDMSPISLVEFNSNAKITTSVTNWEEPWSEEFNHSNRPFVGSPFIELAFPDSNNIRIANNAADRSLSRAQIRLKFRPASYILSRSGLNDRMLYRNKIV